MEEDSLGSEFLGAVTGYGVVVVEMPVLRGIAFNAARYSIWS